MIHDGSPDDTATPGLRTIPRILIVVGEPDLGVTLERFLGMLRLPSRAVRSGASGIRLLTAGRPELVIVDADLSGPVSGLDLLRWIRRRGRATPAVLCIGRSTSDTRQEALAEGAGDYLVKPVSLARLRVAVERALGEPDGPAAPRRRPAGP